MENPCDLVAKVLDCNIIVSESELQSRHYVHFQTKTLGKSITPLVPVTYWPSTKPSIKKQVHPVEDITLTCGRVEFGADATPTRSRCTSNNYITRCHRRFECNLSLCYWLKDNSLLVGGPVCWGCRLHQLLLYRRVKHPPQRMSWYDNKQSVGEVSVMLEL